MHTVELKKDILKTAIFNNKEWNVNLVLILKGCKKKQSDNQLLTINMPKTNIEPADNDYSRG